MCLTYFSSILCPCFSHLHSFGLTSFLKIFFPPAPLPFQPSRYVLFYCCYWFCRDCSRHPSLIQPVPRYFALPLNRQVPFRPFDVYGIVVMFRIFLCILNSTRHYHQFRSSVLIGLTQIIAIVLLFIPSWVPSLPPEVIVSPAIWYFLLCGSVCFKVS